MSNLKFIVGPPGTGKTHRLMHYLEAELKMTKPNKIAYIAFSNAAANEAKKRITFIWYAFLQY